MDRTDFGINEWGLKKPSLKSVMEPSVKTRSVLQALSVPANALQFGSVTNIVIADDSITSAKLAASSVTTDKIANYAVTNIKLGNAAVSYPQTLYTGMDNFVSTEETTASTTYTTFTTVDNISLYLSVAANVKITISVTAKCNDLAFVGVGYDPLDPTDYGKETITVSSDNTYRSYEKTYMLSLASGFHQFYIKGKVSSAGTLYVRGRYLLAVPIGV